MRPPFKITEEILESHVDKLCDMISEVQKHRLTILVGNNGTGKSLIRKQLNVRFIKETEEQRNVVRQISMQARTEPRPDLGALSGCMHDMPEEPTSMATWHMLQETIGKHEFTLDKPYYLVFDEMEIGMSKESIMGVLAFIIQKMPYWLDNTLGVMVITHSDLVAKTLYEAFDADFVNIGYDEISRDFEGWVSRDIHPTDFTWLKDWSAKLFCTVRERSHPMK